MADNMGAAHERDACCGIAYPVVIGSGERDLCQPGPGFAGTGDPHGSGTSRRNRRPSGHWRSGPSDRADHRAIPLRAAHHVAGWRGAPDPQAEGKGLAWPASSRPVRCGDADGARMVRTRGGHRANCLSGCKGSATVNRRLKAGDHNPNIPIEQLRAVVLDVRGINTEGLSLNRSQ